ncbi:MAG: LysR family transcriptional regulator [Cellulomonas sp.]|nr:LysR family transcriptional regulator [Cellulomonas sp.]
MEIHHLRCFVAVAEELHFGHAAERVHLTPSPVSRAIRELEHELGGELFVRHYHRVAITPLGAALLPRARRALGEIDLLKDEARAMVRTTRARPIRVGVSALCPPDAFEAVAALIGGTLSGRRVDVEVGAASALLPRLDSGEVDLALVQLPLGRPQVSTMVLAAYDVWVVMRADNPLAVHDTLSLAQLAGRTLTLGSPHVEPVAMATMIANLRAHGVRDLVELPEFDHVKLSAHIRHSGGLALTLHPDTGGSARIFDDGAFRLVKLTDAGFKFSLGAAWRDDLAGRDRAVRDAVRVLKEHWRPVVLGAAISSTGELSLGT